GAAHRYGHNCRTARWVGVVVVRSLLRLLILWFIGFFQISQESLERLLIYLWINPVCKITNMARAAQGGCPCLGGLHHRIIQAHWKEHFALLSVLFFQGSLDFVFYPEALDAVFREEQQQFILQVDSFVDARTKLVAYLQVFGSEPTPDTMVLQVSMQAADQHLVFAGI